MKSFDVFDTLIARKCIQPQAIFSLVEQRMGIRGFAAVRVEAERQLQGSEYSLDEIYLKIVANSGITDDLAARAKHAELTAELENVIPIEENLRRVSDGDVLITDIYLPLSFVSALLQRAGLRKKCSIIRSADGKATGRAWDSLRRAKAEVVHLGDNPHSDVEMPRRYGFAAMLTNVSRPSAVEQYLLARGLTGTALIARTLRLGLPHDVSVAHELQQCQAGINVPLLLLASLYLGNFLRGQRHSYDSILFSSRDCRGWQKIFHALYGGKEDQAPRIEYFFTSRLSRVSASPAYLRYFSGLLGRRTLVVDLCGTGLSLASLLRRAQADASIFLLHHVTHEAVNAFYRQSYDVSLQGVDIHFVLDDSQHLSNLPLELLNYASHPMVLDMDEIEGSPSVFAPRFATSEFSQEQIQWIESMEAAVDAVLPLLSDPLLRLQLESQDAMKPQGLIREALIHLGREAAQARAPMSAFGDTHRLADDLVYSSLASVRRQ